MNLEFHELTKVNQLVNKHIALSDCESGDAIVVDNEDPESKVKTIKCNKCEKEIGEIDLSKDGLV